MSPRTKRRLIDLAILVSVMVPLGSMRWWLPLVVGAFGLWNYYDGMTRMDLPNE